MWIEKLAVTAQEAFKSAMDLRLSMKQPPQSRFIC